MFKIVDMVALVMGQGLAVVSESGKSINLLRINYFDLKIINLYQIKQYYLSGGDN